ncbi:hypothetical protein C8J56DRAFT_1173576 [Mycena floridula]|nr:hypothetical protein C8J56DRAFT_1173576 [Mycena floridula]
MKLDGSAPLVSANAADIVNLLSPKFTLIGTILAAVGLALLGQYSSLTKNLEALQFLKADIESTTRETLAGGTLDSEFIIEVYDARDEFNISVSDCRLHYYRLSTTSSLSYPVAVARLRWSIRAAKKDGRALLNKIRTHSESENRRRLLGDMKRKVIDKITFLDI